MYVPACGLVERPGSLCRAFVLLLAFAAGGCATVQNRGTVLEQPIGANDPGYWTTLQVRWLGTSSFLIQLGDTAVLTDPFFTYHSVPRVLLGRIQSDAAIIARKLDSLPAADAIFVGHSHYDHMLDLAGTLQRPGWQDTLVFGSRTTRNILCGYREGLKDRWRPAMPGPTWHDVVPGLAYQALPAEHAPNLQLGCMSVWLFPGDVKRPLCKPPTRARDFKMGDTYAYLLRLSNRHAVPPEQHREFTIYVTSAATNAPRGYPDDSVQTVDVAILCVPGWRHVCGYPSGFIRRLKPRHVVASHYDDMFQPCACIRGVIPTAHLPRFVREVNKTATHPGFERLIVPRDGELMLFEKS